MRMQHMVGLHLFSHSFCRFNICQTDRERRAADAIPFPPRGSNKRCDDSRNEREREKGAKLRSFLSAAASGKTRLTCSREGGKNSIFYQIPC